MFPCPIRKNRFELPTELLAMKSRKIASSMFGFMREPLLAPIATKGEIKLLLISVYKDATKDSFRFKLQTVDVAGGKSI